MNIRKACFAGSWYPGSAGACEAEIRQFLKEGKSGEADGRHRLGGIVPHAGWYFSGSIACDVIHRLTPGPMPDAVIVFGMHLHPESLPCIMPEGAWETPFGSLPVQEELAAALLKKFSFQKETSEKFVPDNTIELQLPFIRYFFPETKILALGVPPAEISLEIARSLTEISAEMQLGIRVIGSTDLTHYGRNYGFAPKGVGTQALEWVRQENDRKFIDTVLSMNPPEIIREGQTSHNACCAGAAAAAVTAVKELGSLTAESLCYATSHDKHPGESFVGYAGIVFA